MLFENASAVAFLPYFARYAYECYVAPKETHASLATMSAGERRDLAAALKSLLVRYDNLWQMSFPYVLTLHQAPTDGADYTRLSLPHRMSSAAAQAAPAEVPRRPRDRRRQLPERHAARGEGGGAAGACRTSTTRRAHA